MNTNHRKVRCPQCGLDSIYSSENKFRPFCSERCKLIDLGEWASESYRVPVKQQSYNEKEIEAIYSLLEQGQEQTNPDQKKLRNSPED